MVTSSLCVVSSIYLTTQRDEYDGDIIPLCGEVYRTHHIKGMMSPSYYIYTYDGDIIPLSPSYNILYIGPISILYNIHIYYICNIISVQL